MSVQRHGTEFVNLVHDKVDNVGWQVRTVVAKQLFHALVVEAAFINHQRRSLVATVTVLAVIDRGMGKTGAGFPREGALGAAAAFVVAELKLLRLLRLVDPDDQVHGLRREPAATQFTGDLSHITDFSERVDHLISV